MATEQFARTQRMGIRVAAVMLWPPRVLDGVLAASVLAASATAWDRGRRRGQPLWKRVAVGDMKGPVSWQTPVQGK